MEYKKRKQRCDILVGSEHITAHQTSLHHAGHRLELGVRTTTIFSYKVVLSLESRDTFFSSFVSSQDMYFNANNENFSQSK